MWKYQENVIFMFLTFIIMFLWRCDFSEILLLYYTDSWKMVFFADILDACSFTIMVVGVWTLREPIIHYLEDPFKRLIILID